MLIDIAETLCYNIFSMEFMSVGQILLCVWLIAINALGIKLTVQDKLNAIKREWRVRESTLFLVAFLMGAPGIYLAMLAVRHKTKKFFFYMGVPMLCWWTLLIFSALFFLLA